MLHYDMHLEKEQIELLSQLVQAHNRLPRTERCDFKYEGAWVRNGSRSRIELENAIADGHLIAMDGTSISRKEDLPKWIDNDVISHPGLSDKELVTLQSDIDVLKYYDLISFRDAKHFSITPKAFTFINSLISPQDEPANSSSMTNSTIDIFISHSSADSEIAECLIELLEFAIKPAHGIRCTSVDGYRLPAGATTDHTLKAEVHDAKVFLGLVTSNSLQSAYVMFELGARWGAGLQLVPLLAAGLKPHALQGPLSAINALSCDSRPQILQLIHEIASALETEVALPAAYDKYLQRLLEASSKAANKLAQSQPEKSPTTRVKNNIEIRRISRDVIQVRWSDIIDSPVKSEKDGEIVYLVPSLGEVTVGTKTADEVNAYGPNSWIQLYDGTAVGSRTPQYFPGRIIPG